MRDRKGHHDSGDNKKKILSYVNLCCRCGLFCDIHHRPWFYYLKKPLTHVIFSLVKKPFVLVKHDPERLYSWGNLPLSTIFGPFWSMFNASVTHIGFKRCFHISKWSLERVDQLMLSLICSKNHYFWSKVTAKEKIPKVTQITLCRAKRTNTEQPPLIRFHPAWYQTMLGGGPAHD